MNKTLEEAAERVAKVEMKDGTAIGDVLIEYWKKAGANPTWPTSARVCQYIAAATLQVDPFTGEPLPPQSARTASVNDEGDTLSLSASAPAQGRDSVEKLQPWREATQAWKERAERVHTMRSELGKAREATSKADCQLTATIELLQIAIMEENLAWTKVVALRHAVTLPAR